MNNLTHYIVVRRDLPAGVIAAMIAHAAGESFFEFGRRGSAVGSAPPGVTSGPSSPAHQAEVAGSSPAPCSIPPDFEPSHTRVVVLGIRNEDRLSRLSLALDAQGIEYVPVREMFVVEELVAIGLLPIEADRVGCLLRDCQTLWRATTLAQAAVPDGGAQALTGAQAARGE